MLQGEICADKIVNTVAAVFEPMELCEHDQPLKDHGLETRFDKTKVIEASKSGGDMRRRRCGKDVDIHRSPIDQTFRADRVNPQRELRAGLGYYHPRDASRLRV